VKYLFFLIFSLNIIFYNFLILKPLNIESDFSIDKGDKLNEIFTNLEEKNIYLPKAIKLIFNASGRDKKIYLGKYKINNNDSLIDIFKKIYFGKIILKKFIVPEGSKITDLFSKEVIKSYCQNLNLQNDCELEGYIKPDIYFYDRESEFLSILKKSIDNQTNDLNKSWKERSNKLNNLSKKEILIIASILEKESCANERERISGVIHNRLKKNMLLQMDSTTIYGLQDFNGNLKKKDLRDSSLYNTYMYKGLPPGPISNPSNNSIFAAAQPEEHDYLYFVAKDKCSHEFSTNYEDHLKAVKKYQLNQ
jgi:UPF0755 protein|tara:strand:- start:21 stop:941 length:921 start_codon:yes stop_codon:yes gene_type:complete